MAGDKKPRFRRSGRRPWEAAEESAPEAIDAADPILESYGPAAKLDDPVFEGFGPAGQLDDPVFESFGPAAELDEPVFESFAPPEIALGAINEPGLSDQGSFNSQTAELDEPVFESFGPAAELDEPVFESFAPPEIALPDDALLGTVDEVEESRLEAFESAPEPSATDDYWADPVRAKDMGSSFLDVPQEEEEESWWDGSPTNAPNPYAELMALDEVDDDEVLDFEPRSEEVRLEALSRAELKELREALAERDDVPFELEPAMGLDAPVVGDFRLDEVAEFEVPSGFEADYPSEPDFPDDEPGYVPASSIPEVTIIGGAFSTPADQAEPWREEVLDAILPIEDDGAHPPAEEVWNALEAARAAERQADVDELLAATTREYQGLAEEIERSKGTTYQQQAVAASMPGLDTGLIGFEDVTGITPRAGSEFEQLEQQRSSDLALRIGSGMILISLFLGSLMLGGGVFAGFVTLVMVLGLGEFYAAVRKAGYRPVAAFGLAGLGVAAFGAYKSGPYAIAAGLILCLVLVAVFYTVMNRQAPLENAAVTVLGMAWVAMLSFAIVVGGLDETGGKMILIVAVVAAFDSGAYFIGRMFGKHHLAPVVSPKKTWEGFAGGVVLTFLVAGFMATLPSYEYLTFNSAMVMAAGVSVLAPLGDAFESVVKRALNVKDMGSLIPGHGGMLDRVDALLFVAPAAYLFFHVFGYL